jgi:hypothetical protein
VVVPESFVKLRHKREAAQLVDPPHTLPGAYETGESLHVERPARRDGTTVGERFTGQKHDDLFTHLVSITPPPARPRVRKRKEKPPMLAAACVTKQVSWWRSDPRW